MFDFIVKNTFKVFAKIFYNYKVLNKSNFPKRKQGALIVANHISYLDSFLIAGWTPRMVRFVLLKQIYEGKLHWLFKGVKIIPITPSISKAKLDEFNVRCRKMIDSGELVYIFSEGEMSRVNYLLPFKKGLEYIAKDQGIKVIPVHYDNTTGSPTTYKPGTGKTYGFNLKSLQRKIVVNIGTPIKEPITAYFARQKMNELAAESFPYRIKQSKTLERVLKSLMKRNKVHLDNKSKVKSLISIIPADCHRLFSFYLLAFDQVIGVSKIDKISEISKTDDLFTILFDILPNICLSKNVPLNLGYWKLDESFAIVAMNAPNLISKDVTGVRIKQICKKPESVGRPLPGIAIKVVDELDISKELPEDETGLLMIKGYAIDFNPEIDKSRIIDGWYNTKKTGHIDFDGFVYLNPTP